MEANIKKCKLCIFLALKGKASSFIFSNKHSFPSEVDLKHLKASLIIHIGDSYLEPSKNERTASFRVIPFVLQYTLFPHAEEAEYLPVLDLLPTQSSSWLLLTWSHRMDSGTCLS